jgi:predicted flap endonuclease-1-like 5' DNA nuclease
VENREIARNLDDVAGLLAAQGENPFRVAAYRRAAATLRGLDRRAEEVLRAEGRAGLTRMVGIGDSLAASIEELVGTGRLAFLDRLRGRTDPEALLAGVPGIGPKTARRIHQDLGIATLEDLELAAHDGRLRGLGGFGPKRLQGLRDALAGRLRRRPQPPPPAPPPPDEPSVAELLDVDAEYRHKAGHGALPTIAPRRFNPSGEAWLPIIHVERRSTRYTALFSNTARAHELGATRDWVVIYFHDGVTERQCTVVTERRGPLAGRRVVRGREPECRAYYAAQMPAAPQAA